MSSVLFFGKRIPTAKTVWMALQSVKGLGPTLSLQMATAHINLSGNAVHTVCESLGYSRDLKLADVNPSELKKIQQYIEQNYFVGRELDKIVAADKARLASIGAWRGRTPQVQRKGKK